MNMRNLIIFSSLTFLFRSQNLLYHSGALTQAQVLLIHKSPLSKAFPPRVAWQLPSDSDTCSLLGQLCISP